MEAQRIPANNDYAELRRRLSDAGVFRSQYLYYACHAVMAFTLLFLATWLLFVIGPFWLKIIDAAFLSIAFLQFAYVIHDAGHREIFKQPGHNDLAMLVAGFVIGSSRSWWFDTHNRHHAHPNDLELDPNTQLPVLAFSEEQALAKKGFLRFAVRYQALYFLPLLCLEGIGVRAASFFYIKSGKAKYPAAEALGLAAHLLVYGAIIFVAMPVWQAFAFIFVHQLMAGFYLGSIFAPNHKGTMVPAAGDGLGFFEHQALSSRNIRPNPAIDFFYGGLNYQIEHHLFPTIPRNQLPAARRIVRQFCAERGLPYNETGLVASYVEVLTYFHKMSEPLRSRRARAAFEARRERSRAVSGAVSTLARVARPDLATPEG